MIFGLSTKLESRFFIKISRLAKIRENTPGKAVRLVWFDDCIVQESTPNDENVRVRVCEWSPKGGTEQGKHKQTKTNGNVVSNRMALG